LFIPGGGIGGILLGREFFVDGDGDVLFIVLTVLLSAILDLDFGQFAVEKVCFNPNYTAQRINVNDPPTYQSRSHSLVVDFFIFTSFPQFYR
jgi:hypothetical protein